MDLRKKVDEKNVLWPVVDWDRVKAKNMGGSFNGLQWKETDWSVMEPELKHWGLTRDREPELGLAVELVTTSGYGAVSAIRLLWRHENALYHGVLMLKNVEHPFLTPDGQKFSPWKFAGAVVHDVTLMDWEAMSTKASGWVEDIPLPLMGDSRRAWQEGKTWFISQQENCLLKAKQKDLPMSNTSTKPAL